MSKQPFESDRLREICRDVAIELCDINSFADRAEIEKYVYPNFYFNNVLDSYLTYVGLTE
jgi:hypothetical protein